MVHNRNFPLSLTRLLITACFIEAIASAPVDVVLNDERSMDKNTDENSRAGIPFLSPDSDAKASVITGMIMIVPVPMPDLAGIAGMMGGLGGLGGGGGGSPAGALTSLAGPVSSMIPGSKSAALT